MKKSQLFNEVPQMRVSRNLFDLSHEVKMSGKFGYLYPVLLLEALPGDVIRDQMVAQVRFAPMLSPIMHRVDVKTDFFFCPTRLTTNFWEDQITGGQDGLTERVLPYVTPFGIGAAGINLISKGSLWDYMGLPVFEGGVDPEDLGHEQISVLPFRAYQKIWNDYFRDPNLDSEFDLDLELQGDVSANDGVVGMRQRGWERDYFTAALPWAQRGAEVLMPLAGTGTVTYRDVSNYYTEAGGPPDTGTPTFAAGGPQANLLDDLGNPTRVENIDEVNITASDVSINDFRRSLAIQRWLENNARAGGRYIEQIQAHYNVRVPDYRLQRAEYLGGGRQAVTISEVLSTANTAEVPVGDMAGHGISVGKSNRFTYRCQEHGFVIGIMTIIPRTAYDQGIDRLWTRKTKFDFAFPELANLGEQEILSKEIFYSFNADDDAANQSVFGYIPRYAEYKFKQDRIAGDFRDNLAFWHLSRIFTARPTLNSGFVGMQENNTAVEETYRRIFAVQDGTDYLWIQLFHRLTAKRPLPYFGVPSLNG